MIDLVGFHPPLVRRGIFRGVDLSNLVVRFWRLEAMRVDARCSAPNVRWRVMGRGTSAGTAFTAFREITIRLGPGASLEEAVETLLHEVVHCACPLKEGHGELFCRRLVACAREAFGIPVDTATMLALPPTARGCRAYAIDDALVAAMKIRKVGEALREDPEARFDAPPPEDPAVAVARREERRAARVAKREAKARAKLAEWERRAEAAKKIASKWRAKVRYYDRQQEAAKRGKP